VKIKIKVSLSIAGVAYEKNSIIDSEYIGICEDLVSNGYAEIVKTEENKGKKIVKGSDSK